MTTYTVVPTFTCDFWKALTSKQNRSILYTNCALFVRYYHYAMTREIPITLCIIPIYIYIVGIYLYAQTLYTVRRRVRTSAQWRRCICVCEPPAAFVAVVHPEKVREPTPPIYGNNNNNNMHLHRRGDRVTPRHYNIIVLYSKYHIIIIIVLLRWIITCTRRSRVIGGKTRNWWQTTIKPNTIGISLLIKCFWVLNKTTVPDQPEDYLVLLGSQIYKMQILLFRKHRLPIRSEHKISFIHWRTLKWEFWTLKTFYVNILKMDTIYR